MKMIAFVLVLTGLAGLLWMNGSATSQHASASVSAAVDIDSVHWDKMDHAERKAYMKQVVMPKMREAFSEFNPKRFSDMKCITCHGDGAKNDTYKMPNPKLWKLPRTKEGWAKADTSFMRFMRTTVRPKMAAMLGTHEFDMKTKTGFGCGGCHTDEEAK